MEIIEKVEGYTFTGNFETGVFKITSPNGNDNGTITGLFNYEDLFDSIDDYLG